MQTRVLPLDVPDPMHPAPWVEQDEPLASDFHHRNQLYCYSALDWLLDPARHYVAYDRWLFVDPEKPRERLLPDILVALDVPPERRNPDEYDPVRVGRPPDLLAEFLSPSSTTADKRDKPEKYAKLGIREYFLFDVDGRYGVPPVQGWRLARDGSRTPLPSDAEGGVTSEVIPARFVVADRALRVLDARIGAPLLRYGEAVQALRDEEAALKAAEALCRQAEEAHRQAEEENARLRAEIERLRAERREPGS